MSARARSRVPGLAVGVLVLLAVVHLYRKGRGLTFYFDEWNFVLDRRPWNAASFLEPHNEHLSAVPALIYKVLMSTVGIAGHDPYLVVLLLLHGLCGALVFLVVRRRLGDWLGVCACALVLSLGSAWEDVLWAFQIGYLASIAAGLGIVLALDRDGPRARVIACVLLVLALASSGLGVPILAGVALHLLIRGDRKAQAWVWAVPLALYAAWYLGYGEGAVKRENVTDVPAYAVEMISAGMAGLVNQPLEIGRILFAIGAYLLVTRTVRAARMSAPLLGLLAAAAAFWGLTALARAHLGEATISRYVYPSAIALLLIGAEAARGLRPNRVALAVAVVVTGAASLSGLGRFHDGSVELRKRTHGVRVALTAVELAGGRLPREFVPEPANAPQLTAGAYLDAVRELGESPALTRRQLRTGPPADRAIVDATLMKGLGTALVDEAAEPTGDPPATEPPQESPVAVDGPCLTFAPAAPGSRQTVVLPANGVRITAQGGGAAKVALRAWADEPTAIGDVPAGATRVLRHPGNPLGDPHDEPWRVTLTIDTPAEVCSL